MQKSLCRLESSYVLLMTAEITNKLECESAIAALSQYGFSKVHIKRTLKDILRVYDGNEAWPLLKENGYEVVLERLLSGDGLRQRKSQRKDVVQIPGQVGHNKEKKSHVDPDAGNGGGLDCRHPVADVSSNSSFLITPTQNVESSDTHSKRKDVIQTPGRGGHNKEKEKSNLDPDAGNGEGLDCRHPVANISSRNSSFLVTPTRNIENSDIHPHQRNSWTRNGSFPTPAWLEISNASKKGARQKFFHLDAILERLNKDCFKQADYVDNSCIDRFEVKPVKDEKIESLGECLPERCVNSFEVKAVKIETVDVREEGHVSTWFSQQESNLAMFKTQKLADVPHTQHAETSNMCTGCVQQESNPPILKTRKLAEVLHTDHAETSNMSTYPQQESKTQKLADVLHTQYDMSHVALETTGNEQSPKKDHIGKGLKKRKRVLASEEHCEKTSEPVAAVQTKRPRTQSTGQRTNNLQSTLHATERLDIARMSACKLTRRRDGGPNPMFARLQKLKQAGAEASVSQNNQEKSSVLNESQCGAAQSDIHTGTYTSQAPNLPSRAEEALDTFASQAPNLPSRAEETLVCADPVSLPESPRLPPGFSEPCGDCASQEPTFPGREEDYQDPIPSDESPRLPPGFLEPCASSPESPRLPPGFWEWPDSEPAHDDLRFEARKSNGRSSSRLSPDLPPGFWKSKEGARSSPSGKYMARKPPSLWVSSSCEVSAKDSQEGNEEFAKSKGTPLKQVFIANIPEGYEGAEQKLYSLVRKVLEGFKSVPISATLPCKIQVTEDHAFVEFYCEAMAGIFMDAYHANASVLRIDGEQLVAARSLHRMKMDIQLRRAVANRLRGQVLDPRNVFYLGNVPSEWQNEERLSSHISTLLEGTAHSTLTSKTVSVYTIPDFSDVYVHIPSSILAETFFLRCLSDKEHLEEISTSLFVCRNSTFLPRAARVSLGL